MTLIIREAARADADALAALHVSSWRDTYRGLFADAFLDGAGEDDFAARVAAEWAAFPFAAAARAWMAEDVCGAPVAAGLITVLKTPERGHTPYVDHLHVRPDLRGRGIGARLLRAAAAGARARGETGLWLTVAEKNAGARRFYRRMGGVEQARVIERPHGVRVPALRVIWRDLTLLTQDSQGREGD